MRQTIGFLVAVTLAAGCVTTVGGEAQPGTAADGSSPSAQVPTPADFRSAQATLSAESPDDCLITRPLTPLVPPSPAPHRPPAYYDAAWFGTLALWTMISREGELWTDLPHGPDGFSQKTFWWSADWDPQTEPEPAITVSGRKLDGSDQFATSGRGTNAAADFGVAMLVGVEVPSRGCWEVTGTYRSASLTYTVWVEG